MLLSSFWFDQSEDLELHNFPMNIEVELSTLNSDRQNVFNSSMVGPTSTPTPFEWLNDLKTTTVKSIVNTSVKSHQSYFNIHRSFAPYKTVRLVEPKT